MMTRDAEVKVERAMGFRHILYNIKKRLFESYRIIMLPR
jgi:hypothetical protein